MPWNVNRFECNGEVPLNVIKLRMNLNLMKANK